jgi:hypothetical protein
MSIVDDLLAHPGLHIGIATASRTQMLEAQRASS